MDELSTTVGIVALAAGGVAVLAVLLCLVLMLRLRRVRSAQKLVLGEQGTRDVVGHTAAVDKRVQELKGGIDQLSAALFRRLDEVEARLDGSVSKTAVLRYDAFNETSGRQSSTVALLDDGDNGVLISAILQREQARVYAKPVVGGRSSLELSPEEREAMSRARSGGPVEDPSV